MSNHILFIGDSITEGKLGISFVDMIKRRFPDIHCHNKGHGGDTLLEIKTRLIKILKEDKYKYSTIVIEAGHNDILLPHLKLRWPVMRIKWVTMVPQIGIVLDQMLKIIISFTNAKIILTTLSCLGEIFGSQLNQKRRLINEQIKVIGYRYNTSIADVGSFFDEIILDSNSSSYLLDNPINIVFDYFRSKKLVWADKISRKRNLWLTIDGGHLNSKGAKIYCREISKILDNIFQYK
ncbi:MAG: SGNH/GDSL hydrolase family protein [Candidatus Lokiarchaeota archaeon]|nr:SGNH/GDSL hydrolase family protein [Candidatus Lokiarchaeota archaeon]